MTRALLLLAVVALAAAGPMKLYEKTEAEKFQKGQAGRRRMVLGQLLLFFK